MRRTRVQWLIFLSLILAWIHPLSAQSKIYWLSDTGSTRTFYRANIDGSQIEKMATVLYRDKMHNFVIDTLRQRFYVAWHAGRIYSYSFDGQISKQLVKKTIEKDNITYGPYALTWHRKSDKLYYSVANTIYRCDMDGSHVEVVFESIGAITDIQIDEENDRIFWASSATNRKQNSTIFTANLDGSSKRALYSGNLEYVLDIKHISLYLTEEHLYFSWGVWGGDIFRVDKWGLNYEKICSYNYQYFATPSADFIVAPQINQIFWVDFHQKYLFSAPLDDIPDQVVPIVSDSYKPMAVKVIIEKPLDFTLSKTEGKVPLAIDFKSQFGDQADSYLWDFGDGSTSSEKNPSHIYEKTGIFTVKLQISKDGKKDSVIKKDLVESYMSGYISGTLPANLSPYHIRESLIVSSRLSIEPGAILIFDDSDQVGIDLSGELIAKGTESNPIIFTCKTLFNGSKLSWQGIKADEGSKLVLQHCHLDNAVFGVQAQSGTDLEISNSSLTECYSTAIVIGDEGFGSSNHIIRENIIENNREWGIKLVCVATINDKNIQTPIKGNLIQNNGAGGLYLEARGAGSSSWTSTSATAEIESEITSNQIRFNNGPALQFRADGKRTEGQHSVHVAHGYVSPLIQNNIFEGNSASILSNTGVGSSNLNHCNIQLDKNTFFNAGPFELDGNTIVSLTNSIIWGHVAPVVSLQNSAEMTITYSNIKGGFEGTGNLELEPLFVDAENGNFHLSPTSPCIDSGDPAADYTSEPTPNGGRVNMGAFGNTKNAQTSSGTLVKSNISQPHQFRIDPPFPNPFNSQTTIHFSLNKSQQVKIDIINTNGQIVQTIFNEHKKSGAHVCLWNARELSSGIYFLQLSTPYKTAIQKCTLIK